MTFLHNSNAFEVNIVNIIHFFGISNNFFVILTTMTVQHNARWNVGALSTKFVEDQHVNIIVFHINLWLHDTQSN